MHPRSPIRHADEVGMIALNLKVVDWNALRILVLDQRTISNRNLVYAGSG